MDRVGEKIRELEDRLLKTIWEKAQSEKSMENTDCSVRDLQVKVKRFCVDVCKSHPKSVFLNHSEDKILHDTTKELPY